MSDENMNINSDEADLLFVSAKKKKQAEDEAKKRAAEEQAKREAAEAAVLQMEKEVEERRRKAEEEKKALEEAEKAPKPSVESVVKAESPEKKEKVKKEIKIPAIPKIAYIIAAAVVVVAVILIVALGGKKGTNIEDIKFDADYQVPDTPINIKYPKDDFKDEITQQATDSGLALIEIGENKKVQVRMVVAPNKTEGEQTKIGHFDAIANACSLSNLAEFGKQIEGFYENFAITEEKIPDVVNNPKDSVYTCKFTYDKEKSGAGAAWIVTDEEGYLYTMACFIAGKDKDPEYPAKLCDLFVQNNSQNLFMGVGSNPPTSTDLDGMLKIEEGRVGIPIPLHSFEEIEYKDGCHFYTDKNGAIIIAFGKAFDGEPSTEQVQANRDSLIASFQISSKELFGSMLGEIASNRQMTTERAYDASEKTAAYEADYSLTIKDVPYWERDFCCAWRDITDDVWYGEYILMYSPAKNRDVYQPLFEKSIANLADL